MSDAAAKHAVLLDVLEAAGFPRSALTGAGNAFHLDCGVSPAGSAVTFGAFEKRDKDNELSMVLQLNWGPSGTPPQSIAIGLTKLGARNFGAFLLAWGHRP